MSRLARRPTLRSVSLRQAWEFDTPGVIPPEWAFITGVGRDGGIHHYSSTSDVATVDNASNLAITAHLNPSNNIWYSAWLQTQIAFNFQYGYIEGRMQLPLGQGMFPAFWLLCQDWQPNWPLHGEIDIMEAINLDQYISGTLHYKDPTTGAGAQLQRFAHPSAGDWHTYGVDWRPNLITFYCDGLPYGSIAPADLPAGAWPLASSWPKFIVLNLCVGGSFPGNPDGTTPTSNTMLIDYVRLYA